MLVYSFSVSVINCLSLLVNNLSSYLSSGSSRIYFIWSLNSLSLIATFSGNTTLLFPRIPVPVGVVHHFLANKLGKIPDKILSKNHSFDATAGAWKSGYPPSAIYPL